MKKYPIKKCNVDFKFEGNIVSSKGTRAKRLVKDI